MRKNQLDIGKPELSQDSTSLLTFLKANTHSTCFSVYCGLMMTV